jgi:4-diphosphocytidyl-2-C-methyl-D-erythritol kinase
MVVFPNCKINLGLKILEKREDGFHNLETIFYPVGIKDALEIIPHSGLDETIEYTGSGNRIEGSGENNLCIKAYDLLKKDFKYLPAIKIHLHKAIPIGAGLGGGSADGAFALKLLNEKFQLDLSDKQLLNYAAQLGSDCPFFMLNKPCFASGRGEILEEINLDLSHFKIALVNPGIHINTAWAFAALASNSGSTPPIKNNMGLKEVIRQPVGTWKDTLQNDFEKPVFESYPGLQEIKKILYQLGAVYSSMSGSGSTMFGIFEEEVSLSVFESSHYFATFSPYFHW